MTARLLPLLRRFGDVLALLAVLIAAAVFFRIQEPSFGKLSVQGQILSERADLIVLAIAMTFVLLVGEIDLSVGSVLALSSVVFGEVLGASDSASLATIAALVTGTLCGAVNGWLTVALRIPSFVVTLGMMEIARGLAYWLSGFGRVDVGGRLAGFVRPWSWLENVPVLGTMRLAPAVFLALALAIVGHVVLRRTVFGRHCQAIGGNARAFELSGERVGWRKVAVFAVVGAAAGLAALLQTARLDTTDPTGGVAMELTVIAAVVVGGTTLTGGRASVVGTLLGCLLIAVLQSGLSQIGTGEAAKRISTGAVIVFAVLLDAWRRRTR